MQVLKPVPMDEIPGGVMGRGRRADYGEIYERVLGLNGLAVPVEFETPKEARAFQTLQYTCRSRMKTLGIRAVLRGNIAFVYKPSSDKSK